MSPYKQIKMRMEKWQVVKDLATLLSKKRGTTVSLPDAVVEAATRMMKEESK